MKPDEATLEQSLLAVPFLSIPSVVSIVSKQNFRTTLLGPLIPALTFLHLTGGSKTAVLSLAGRVLLGRFSLSSLHLLQPKECFHS